MNKVILLLGSNLGNRIEYLENAIREISNFANIADKSSIVESEPWGFKAENNFLNQVILVDTKLDSRNLLKQIQKIENLYGRKRNPNEYISRTLDLDILYFNDQIISEPDLIIPHPQLHKRKFTLLPLAQLAPSHVHPTLKLTQQELLDACTDKCPAWFIYTN